MGIQWFAVSTKMMKSIVFAALVAAAFADAEPKADADAYYGGYYGLGAYGYSGLGYRSYGYAAHPYSYGAYSYAAHPYSYGSYHAIGKRSADAEPTADADAYYGGYYGYGGYAPYSYGYARRAYAYSPYTYGGYRSYYH